MKPDKEKVYVYVVTYSSDEGQGTESVHKTQAGAEAKIRKVQEEGLDGCEYEFAKMELMP